MGEVMAGVRPTIKEQKKPGKHLPAGPSPVWGRPKERGNIKHLYDRRDVAVTRVTCKRLPAGLNHASILPTAAFRIVR
jgi:hypothetical protein